MTYETDLLGEVVTGLADIGAILERIAEDRRQATEILRAVLAQLTPATVPQRTKGEMLTQTPQEKGRCVGPGSLCNCTNGIGCVNVPVSLW